MSDRRHQDSNHNQDLPGEDPTDLNLPGEAGPIAAPSPDPPNFYLPAIPIAAARDIHAPASRALASGDDLLDFVRDSRPPASGRAPLDSSRRSPSGALDPEHFSAIYPEVFSSSVPAEDPIPEGPNPALFFQSHSAPEQYSTPDFPITPFTPFAALPNDAGAPGLDVETWESNHADSSPIDHAKAEIKMSQGSTSVEPQTAQIERPALAPRENAGAECFVSGHDFSRADNANELSRALAPAENVIQAELCNKGTALAGPQMQHDKCRASAPAENLIQAELCNKGTALAGPQMQHDKSRALAPAENVIQAELCNKGTALAGPQMQHDTSPASAPAENLIQAELCNKGTALAGPQMQHDKSRALAPAENVDGSVTPAHFETCESNNAASPYLIPPPTFHFEPEPESRIPNFAHLLILGIIALFGFVAAGLTVRSLFRLHLWGAKTIEQASNDVHYTLASMAVLYLVSFAVAFFVFPLLWHKPFFAGLQWNARSAIRYRYWLFAAASFCFMLAIVDQFILPGPTDAPIDKMFSNSAAAWLLFGFGVLVAPLFEEIIFRGFLLPALCTAVDWALSLRAKPTTSLLAAAPAGPSLLPLGPDGHPQWSVPAMIVGSILTSLPFAAMHADQIANSAGPLILLFCVSLILCFARLATRSLAASIFVHASYNFLLFFIMLVGTGGFKHLDKM